MSYNLIISGGGTGGHIYPAISIADRLRKNITNCNILFIGAKNKMEMKKVPENGYKIIGLYISGLQRKFNLYLNLLLPFKIILSLIHSLIIILIHKPKIVIGTGGYASGPIMYVASILGIPVFIQEQNSYPGLTNRILSKYAKKIFVAYDGMDKYFNNSKIIVSGNPIRKSIKNISLKNRNDYLKSLNFKKDLKTLLFLGGSLGADRLNKFVKDNLDFFKKNDLQVILQCGSRYFNTYKYLNSVHIKVLPFIKEMDKAYSSADIIISRSGASIISELCFVGKPVILIPSPNVADNHQSKNAKKLYDIGAAEYVDEDEADYKLTSIINKILVSEVYRNSLSKKIKTLSKPNASKIIVNEIKKFLK
ncbi:MAG: undecaprenyldiphospho-muramoylpentapeptide beta-N-acetylglucosaminyltransferase [Flavobacteriales bacterium]|nr:undecaprenyldiphospho-muramoylpentapeptide beta-N-acetylglucosaminyltransferase [Flavobacteriales bacterium]|tara:strand:- start:1391 stop:2482 length:1092 start_codon:yes stop_codon:yes gene_type:complete